MAHDAPRHVGFLGPVGTFTEEALFTQPDYRAAELTPYATMADVLDAVQHGREDLGFVPIENAIDGTVRDTIDTLVFDTELLIQREVVLDIHLHLMAPRGTTLDRIRQVASIPVAIAQCRKFLAGRLPDVEVVPTTSTAEAARLVGKDHPAGLGNGGGAVPNIADGAVAAVAAVAPRLCAEIYGLEVLAEDVEDHPENQTRFVAVARSGIPAPTGHDRTSIACFQSSDHPGSLHGILGQFSARNINLTKLESRPTKRVLGEYCFIIDLEGHIADAVVADCLRELHVLLPEVKLLGSYPAAGAAGPARRRAFASARIEADRWLDTLLAQVDNTLPPPPEAPGEPGQPEAPGEPRP